MRLWLTKAVLICCSLWGPKPQIFCNKEDGDSMISRGRRDKDSRTKRMGYEHCLVLYLAHLEA